MCVCVWQSALNNCNQEDVSEFYTIFVLTFQASMGFSVVKVIMGVFLQNTFSVAANDDVKLGRNSFRMRHPLALSIWTDTVVSCCYHCFLKIFLLNMWQPLWSQGSLSFTRLLNTDSQASLMTHCGRPPSWGLWWTPKIERFKRTSWRCHWSFVFSQDFTTVPWISWLRFEQKIKQHKCSWSGWFVWPHVACIQVQAS